jgi:2-hydroxychromene-2-carboxylate isomerase
MTRVTWYYDVISPFAYLQSARLAPLAQRVDLECVPVLFAGLLDHWGQKGPAEVPPKKVFAFRQCAWRARRDGIPYRTPPKHPFNPLRALRLAIALGGGLEVVQKIFASIWVAGALPDDAAGWGAMQKALGIDNGDALVARPEVKQALLDNGARAIAAGVFGVPTLAIEGELFWGDDALDMAYSFLADRTLFDDEDMRRIVTLSASAERRAK